MVKKLGKRKRKALAKAKRQKGLKDIPTDHITKLLYVGAELKKIAEENGVDYCKLSDLEEEDGEYWTPDRVESSGLTFSERKELERNRD